MPNKSLNKNRILTILSAISVLMLIVLFIFKDTVLWVATYNGYNILAKVSLLFGADANAKDENNTTLLMGASLEGHKKIVKYLIDGGANINYKSTLDSNALTMAIQGGHDDIVSLLIDEGADFNESSFLGGSALITATIQGHKDIVKTLIESGADVNARLIDGSTVLMNAAANRHADIVELLVNADADVNAKNREGSTAMMIALQNDDRKIAAILSAHGAEQSGYDPRIWAELFNENASIESYKPSNISTFNGITVKEYHIGAAGVAIPGVIHGRRNKLRLLPAVKRGDTVNEEKISTKYIEGSKVPREGSQYQTKEKLAISIGDYVVHTLEVVSQRWAEDEVIFAFYSFENNWVLAYRDVKHENELKQSIVGNVIVDGVNIGDTKGYLEVFNYTFINNKPFYFFVDRNRNTRMSYAGTDLPYRYDYIYHFECCGGIDMNPEYYQDVISFIAKRADSLYYVEAGFFVNHL